MKIACSLVRIFSSQKQRQPTRPILNIDTCRRTYGSQTALTYVLNGVFQSHITHRQLYINHEQFYFNQCTVVSYEREVLLCNSTDEHTYHGNKLFWSGDQVSYLVCVYME